MSPLGASVLTEFFNGAGNRIVNVHFSGADKGVMHVPSKGNPWADEALHVLIDSEYNGLLTLEINDLSYIRPLTYDEKITILSDDVEYVRHMRD